MRISNLALLAAPASARLTRRVCVDSQGLEGNQGSGDHTGCYLDISPDPTLVAFTRFASSLASGDTHGVNDIFVHDWVTEVTTRLAES